MTPDNQELSVALREDFYTFVVWAFGVLSPPDDPYTDNWHIEAIAHRLMKVYQGETHRLLIMMPPRYGKSVTANIAFVAWLLGHHPSLKFLCGSYGEKHADEMAEATRTLMRRPEYQQAFPNTKFSDHSPLDMMKMTKGGLRMATSVGSAATGFGCDYVIVDDLTKAEATAGEREKAVGFFRSSMLTRLNNKANGRAIVIGQRTATDDLPGYLLDQGGWEVLELSAIAQADEKIEIGTGRQHFRAKGQVLHAGREDLATLDRIRREIGDENFAAQYLQRPDARFGSILDPAWFPPYDKPRSNNNYQFRVLSIDTAMGEKATSDYSACSVFGIVDDRQYLLHVWRDRLGVEALFAKVDDMIKEWGATHITIEYANVGISLANSLHKRFGRSVIPFMPRFERQERLARLINVFRKGTIHLPMDAPWKAEFEAEIFSYPSTAHDDQLDTLIQFANHVEEGYGTYPSIQWAPQLIRRRDVLAERYGHLIPG